MNNLQSSRRSNQLDTPTQYVLVVIDPQKAFVDEDGTFAKAFGIEDLVKMREAIIRTGEFIKELPDGTKIIFVRSEYKEYQFGEESPMSQLCDPYINNDCEWSDLIDVPECATIITKNKNDACESPEFIDSIYSICNDTNGKVCIVFTGVTTTTCVKKTVLSTRNQFPGVKVVVPFDSVGARLKYYKGKNDPEADYDAAETISPYIGNYDSKVAEIADKMWTQGITVTTLDQLIKEFNSQ